LTVSRTSKPKRFIFILHTRRKKRKEVITMDRKWSLAVFSIGITLLAVTCATASSWSSTPLYTFRMEQASSQMNFLPVERSGFTYTAEKGYSLNYGAGCCFVNPLEEPTYWETCSTCEYTCEGGTCEGTCYSTCPNTCATCEPTCEQNTCWNTCDSTCSTCKPCSTYRDCP